MTYNEFIEDALLDFPGQMPDYAVLGRSMYRAIRDMQRDTLCSVAKFDFPVTTSTKELALSALSYALGANDPGTEGPSVHSTVDIFYVKAVYEVQAGGTLCQIFSTDQGYIDNGTAQDPIQAVGWDRNSLKFFTTFDMNGKTMRVHGNFVIHYPGLEALTMSPLVNLFINMVPVQFQDFLLEGFKAYLYQSAAEVQSERKDYLARYQLNDGIWRNRNLPFISRAVQESQPDDLVYVVRPPRIVDLS